MRNVQAVKKALTRRKKMAQLQKLQESLQRGVGGYANDPETRIKIEAYQERNNKIMAKIKPLRKELNLPPFDWHRDGPYDPYSDINHSGRD